MLEQDRVTHHEVRAGEPGNLIVEAEMPSGLPATLLQPGPAMAWVNLREDGDVPMLLCEHAAAEVLAEPASAMRQTDMVWPRHDDEDFVGLRALVWARCSHQLAE